MKDKNHNQIEKDLHQIADMLLLNGTLTECPGLVHGKMGIAIFFFHYAQYTNNMLFADYAMDVIGEMLDQIHVNSPADYENGVAGIGVGINYLIKNSFLSIEDDVCEDFDQIMTRAVMSDDCLDFTKYNGLVGCGLYWITRLPYMIPALRARECLANITSKIDEHLTDISIMEQMDIFYFLIELQRIKGSNNCISLFEQCQQILDLHPSDIILSFPRLDESVVGNFVRNYLINSSFNKGIQGENNIALQQILNLEMEKAPIGTGLLNGYAGEGMIRLTVLNQINSTWMHLL